MGSRRFEYIDCFSNGSISCFGHHPSFGGDGSGFSILNKQRHPSGYQAKLKDSFVGIILLYPVRYDQVGVKKC